MTSNSGKFLLLILPLMSVNTALYADTIAPFSTDGCSAFPDGTPAQPALWRQCCIAHDLIYWAGGTADDRDAADLELQQCVSDAGEPLIAKLMFAGVRAGGAPYSLMTYRWGYGWHYLRGYAPLTEDEKQQIIDAIDQVTPAQLTPVTPANYFTTDGLKTPSN